MRTRTLMALSVALTGCVGPGTMLPGTIYSTSGRVLAFQIEKTASGGRVAATDASSGEQFDGSYVGISPTISTDMSASAFSGGASAFGGSSSTTSTNIANARAFLRGSKGSMLTCEINIQKGFQPRGIGSCHDQGGQNYVLQF